MNRTELQDNAWTFPSATIGGRVCRLSPARLSLLRRFKNPLITGEADFAAHPGAADEMAFVLSMPREQVKALAAMTDDQRAAAVLDFGLDYEDEIIGALAAINRQMQSIEASAFEAVESPGKSPQEAKPAQDGSPPSIGSPSATG
jgi:hypothetical protein